jgi:hypothetical protein
VLENFQNWICSVKFEVFTKVTMKNAIFWDMSSGYVVFCGIYNCGQ